MLSYKIAIADNDIRTCRKIRELLTIYSTQRDIDIAPPRIFSSCEALLQSYYHGAQYDFLFLAVDFSDTISDDAVPASNRMNGIAFASMLRRTIGNTGVEIIYVTAYQNYAADTIPVRPAGFIPKPVTLQKITSTLDTIMQYRNLTHRFFVFTNRKSQMQIQVSQIQYLNSCGRQIIMKTMDSKISFYGKLSDVMKEKCFHNFLQIHKSYLVNPDYIACITPTTVYLRGPKHETLPISRNQQRNVEKWLAKEF